jgi:lipopolysaccharide export LptBFGC system permease protein LptF
MKLEVHIARELASTFAFALIGILLAALPALAISAIVKLPGADMEMLLSFTPLLLLELLPHAVPVAFMLATVATFSRMAGDHEWQAACMAGWSPLRLALPGLVVALVLAVISWWMFTEGLPAGCRLQRQHQFAALRTLVTRLDPGRTDLHYRSFHLAAKSRDGDEFVQAVIYLPQNGAETSRTIVCERVRFEFEEDDMLVHLTNARIFEGEQEMLSGSPTLRIALEDLSGLGAAPHMRSLRYQSSTELRARLASGSLTAENATKAAFEFHQRDANAATCILFALLGIPLGVRFAGRSVLFSFVVAIAGALVYYVLVMRLGQILVVQGVLSPFIAAWITFAVSGVCGVWMMVRLSMR